MNEKQPLFTWENARAILLWAVLPLVAGLLIAAALLPQPQIGIIRLSTQIDPVSASDLLKQLDYVRQHPEIRGVVLVLDSPGGTVADTEAVYMEMLKVRQQTPIVASINLMAASGAYYLSVGSDYIFCKPTSDVGNIGVIGYTPPAPSLVDGIVSTGPYKLFGFERDQYVRQIEAVKQGFASAVKLGRGAALKAEMSEVLSGKLWPGMEAVRLGLADALGTESDAIEKAAQLAGVRNPKVVEIYPLAIYDAPVSSPFYGVSPDGVTLTTPAKAGLYLLYIPPATLAAEK
ncbi:MAG: hypothetical protein CO094_12985 [Anaerolineae bacterium CG_4_9_14_3_um_filter_57_17]|nr:S49 family peptidase [bacterium]NCT21248.1 S49 family peptidase [bacterium]OIO86463.1 MAG: hypothetical protein AUK01_03005 [Anaerolineae bacterium CG2_30_57_67]PJB64444.1 MAG: hypothetical protein CO094_12985 [Anaerolineae bacterium CG_4_9_14_3_um_filter_57_17]